MRDTGSTRTGTRWPSCRASWGALPLVALLALPAAGCVTRTSRLYLPSEGQPRLSADDVRDRGDTFLRAECPRLMGSKSSAAGSANYALLVGADGGVREARVERTSGDERIDEIFGALAAQLTFPAPQPASSTTAGVTIGYSCSPGIAVTTVELKQ